METRQPQLYKNVVPLSLERHAQSRVDPAIGFGFARAIDAVLLVGVEFSKAAREYPIVFIEDGANVSPVALLGWGDSSNHYVDEGGKWHADYIPAYIRRYPFITATQGSTEELMVCIDEAADSVNTERGEPLFQDGDQQTPYLKRMIDLLGDYQGQLKQTSEFADRLKRLNLLVPMKANPGAGPADSKALSGFLVVDDRRLKSLRPKRLADLIKSDDMAMIYAHLMSLEHFERLLGQPGSAH